MKFGIETENLTKKIGKVTAVNDVSIKVHEGEIYGFLGLNGAGKTTTIRMILGMIKPTSGKALLFGEEAKEGKREIWSKVGYLVEIPHSYPDLTVRENLEIIRKLRSVRDKKAVDNIMEKLGLEQYAGRKVKHLSTGNAQRLGLAKAMIHDPAILVLDEPSNGLDPAGIQEIRELLKTLARDHGVTIFISSHILDEISRFADRIGIIHKGSLIREIETSQLDALCNKRVLVDATDREKAKSILLKEGYRINITEGGSFEINDNEAIAHPEAIAVAMVNEGAPPTLLKVEKESLESYFLRTIGTNGSER